MKNEDSLVELSAMVRGCRELIAHAEQGQQEWWRQLAGPLLDGILRSSAEAEHQLCNPKADIRIVALEVLSFCWKQKGHFASQCEVMAFNDPNPDVRAIALLCLAACYENTDDIRIGRILASVVRDESKLPDFRRAAYRGLFVLRDLQLTWPGLSARPLTALQIPGDIDWAFVDSFLVEGRTSSVVDPVAHQFPFLSNEERQMIREHQKALERTPPTTRRAK